MFNKQVVLILKFCFLISVLKQSNAANYLNLSEISLRGPNKLSNCKAQLDDKSIIDLTSLDKPASPRKVIDPVKDYTYTFNPCSPIDCDPTSPKTTAICQNFNPDPTLFYDLGDQNSVQFSIDSGDNSLIFQYKQGIRTSNLKCVCGTSESFSFKGENPTNVYSFVFTNKCCCPNKCSGSSGGGGSGLSVGSILLIISFSVLAVYFLGGFIFYKFVKKANGIEALPNHAFWTSLPSDIKGGFTFTIGKIRPGQYQRI